MDSTTNPPSDPAAFDTSRVSKEYDNQDDVLTQEGLSRGISLTQIPTLGVQGRGVSLWAAGRGLGGGLRLWSVQPNKA